MYFLIAYSKYDGWMLKTGIGEWFTICWAEVLICIFKGVPLWLLIIATSSAPT